MAKTSTAKVEETKTEAKVEKKIHHATMNRALENDVKLTEMKSGDGYWATHEESGQKVKGATAKEALDALLVKLNPEGAEEGGEVVKEKYKQKYSPNGGNCGDALAKALTTFRAAEKDAFDIVARDNKIAPKQWEGKNKGMQWMCLSNVLRGRVRKGETVLINGEEVKSLGDGVPAKAPKAKKAEKAETESKVNRL